MKVHNILLTAQNFYKKAIWSNFLFKNASKLLGRKSFRKVAADFTIPDSFKLPSLALYLNNLSNAITGNDELKAVLQEINSQVKIVDDLYKKLFLSGVTDGKEFKKLLVSGGKEAVVACQGLTRGIDDLLSLDYIRLDMAKPEDPLQVEDYTTLVERITDACRAVFELFEVDMGAELVLGLDGRKDTDEDVDLTPGVGTSEERADIVTTKELERKVEEEYEEANDEKRPLSNLEKDIAESGTESGDDLGEEAVDATSEEVKELFEEAGSMPTESGGAAGRQQQAEMRYSAHRGGKQSFNIKEWKKSYREAIQFAKDWKSGKKTEEQKQAWMTGKSNQLAIIGNLVDINEGMKRAQKELEKRFKMLENFNNQKLRRKERYQEERQNPEQVQKERDRLKNYLASLRSTYSRGRIFELKEELTFLREQRNAILETLSGQDDQRLINDGITPEEIQNLKKDLKSQYEQLTQEIDKKSEKFKIIQDKQLSVTEERLPELEKYRQRRGLSGIQEVGNFTSQLEKLETHVPSLRKADPRDIFEKWKQRILDNHSTEQERETFSQEIMIIARTKRRLDEINKTGNTVEKDAARKDYQSAVSALHKALTKQYKQFVDEAYLIDARIANVDKDYSEVMSLVEELRAIRDVGAVRGRKGTSSVLGAVGRYEIQEDVSKEEINKILSLLPDAMNSAYRLSQRHFFHYNGMERINTRPILHATYVSLQNLFDELSKLPQEG